MSLELCGRIVDDIARRQRVTYDMPCLIHGDTGTRYNGNDYYQAMIMWSLPAVLEDQDLAGPCKPGGRVDRMIPAARQR